MRTTALLLSVALALAARASDDPIVQALAEATDGLRNPVRLLEKSGWDRAIPAEGRRPLARVLPLRAPGIALADAAAVHSAFAAQLAAALPGFALLPDQGGPEAELAFEAELLAGRAAGAPVAVVRLLDLARSRLLALGINGRPLPSLAPLVLALGKALPTPTIGWPGPRPPDGSVVRVRIEPIADATGEGLAPLLLPWVERELTLGGLALALDAASARRLGELEAVRALRADRADEPVAFLLEGALGKDGVGRLGLRRPGAEKAALMVEAPLR